MRNHTEFDLCALEQGKEKRKEKRMRREKVIKAGKTFRKLETDVRMQEVLGREL